MSMSDPIADMLTRIRNANTAKHDTVDVPASKMKESIAKILLDEGYIKSYEIIEDGIAKTIKITLKYGVDKNQKTISGIKRISKPGLRVYAGKDELPKEMCIRDRNVTRFPYEIARLAQDIAGGLMVTLPSEKDINHPVAGAYIKKYFAGTSTTPIENRFKIMRLIENLTMGTAAVGYLTESLHGAGSPQAQRVVISRQSNMPGKKELAKAIVHIED